MVRILVNQQTKTVAIMEILVILANQMETRTISQNLRLLQTMTQLFPQTMAVALNSQSNNQQPSGSTGQAGIENPGTNSSDFLLSKHRSNLFNSQHDCCPTGNRQRSL